jgi:hypothetical protein
MSGWHEVSPFLHTHERPRRSIGRDHVQEEIQKGKALATLERLRYKRLYVNAVDLHWRVVQRCGDNGRQYAIWYLVAAYAAAFALWR